MTTATLPRALDPKLLIHVPNRKAYKPALARRARAEANRVHETPDSRVNLVPALARVVEPAPHTENRCHWCLGSDKPVEGCRRASCRMCGGLGYLDAEAKERIAAGKAVREMRHTQGLSVWTAAAMYGMTPPQLSRLEAGVKDWQDAPPMIRRFVGPNTGDHHEARIEIATPRWDWAANERHYRLLAQGKACACRTCQREGRES